MSRAVLGRVVREGTDRVRVFVSERTRGTAIVTPCEFIFLLQLDGKLVCGGATRTIEGAKWTMQKPSRSPVYARARTVARAAFRGPKP